MTLVIAALNNSSLVFATDTRLSLQRRDGSYEEVSPNSIKSFQLKLCDANLMVGFCGRAYIDDDHFEERFEPTVVNWLQTKFNDSDLANLTLEETLNMMSADLTAMFAGYYASSMQPLEILVAGWKLSGRERRQVMYEVTNIDAQSTDNPFRATTVFRAVEIHNKTKGSKIKIIGDLRPTADANFLRLKGEVRTYLAHRHSDYSRIIRDRLIDMILLASANPSSGGTIGDKITATIIQPSADGMLVKVSPDNGDYVLPGLVRSDITMLGMEVRGDPMAGSDADIKVGLN